MLEFRVTRRVHEQGGSFLVVLPMPWARAQELEDGDTVDLVYSDIVKVIPSTKEKCRVA